MRQKIMLIFGLLTIFGLIALSHPAHSVTLDQPTEQHGKKRVARYLKIHGDGRLYIRTRSGGIKLKARPSADYVTRNTLKLDMDRLGISENDLSVGILSDDAAKKERTAEMDAARARASANADRLERKKYRSSDNRGIAVPEAQRKSKECLEAEAAYERASHLYDTKYRYREDKWNFAAVYISLAGEADRLCGEN